MKPDNRKNSLDVPDFLVVQALLLFSLALSVQTDPKAAAVTCSCSSKAVGSASFTFCFKKKKVILNHTETEIFKEHIINFD